MAKEDLSMRIETCEDCGAEVSGADRGALLPSAQTHFDEDWFESLA